MTAADVGSYYVDAHGEVWRLLSYTDQPTVTLERLDPFEKAREPDRSATRTHGVVGSPLMDGLGFRKMVPE
jgi:hypothetical protein